MAFTFTNYAGIKPQRSPMHDLLSQILGGYKQGTEAQFLQPNAKEDLLKKQQFNQMYIPDIQSQIGLRGAQTGESGARTELLGEQTRTAHMQNKVLPQKLQNQIQQAMIQQQILRQVARGMGAGQQQGQPTQQPDMQNPQYDPGQGQAPFAQQSQTQQPQPMQQGGLNYSQAAMAMKMLGLGTPKIENINGKYMALTPLGNFNVAQGQTKLQEALSKEDAKKISGLEDIVISGDKKLTTLHDLGEVLSSPTFEEMRQNAALGKHELGWYSISGTKEQKELVGRFLSDTGEIIKDASSDFKGQFRKGEQGLLESMKATPSDALDVMKGKTAALTFMVQALRDRSEMEAQLMRERNMSVLEARKEANRVFNPKGLKEEIKDLLKSKGKPTREGLMAEKERRQSGANL